MTPPLLSPQQVKAAIRDGRELALLDLREERAFSDQGHLLFAAPAPLSRLELVIDALVPRRGARIILTDGDGSLVGRGAVVLARLGYTEVSVLAGGTQAWAAAGFEVFIGTNVPSKAFGEVVELEAGTPHLSAAEVARLQAEGRNLVVLDSRPMAEFRDMSIPGGIDCPGAELVHRARQAAPDPETLVVVNCAGRTRSIIGAQSLINARLPNRVAALENGTMGWEFAGLTLAHDETRTVPPPKPEMLTWAREAAADLARRAGVRSVSLDGLAQFRAETDSRTLFAFDVRSPDEYRAGHMPSTRSAPGGQLVQSTDHYVGTLGARIVLVDAEDVRALVTASWLVQMGWTDVFVLEGGITGPLETGPEPRSVPGLGDLRPDWIDTAELQVASAEGSIAVFDIGSSRAFRAGHIPGAWFTTRARLVDAVAAHAAGAQTIVVTADDVALAMLGAGDIQGHGRRVRPLLGGNAAWRGANLATEKGAARLLAEDDVWLAPAQFPPEQQETEKRRYIQWELDLPAQIARDGDARFRVLQPV
ncbi:rhodanese-like domain-containing protein [Siccirubricoccus sp. G192]|uniref:rhodanese-like domain-containing protein n=1 Tax=Siccirubricoccus sp. G192 TaxID=2849651 RepID=UPI001C2BC02C|nr:rhodanese-like domain-containing protein [Siccirubricoccus sp. G192]MBV1798689.1 thiosulfate sulfurtransferase [Siccirubricoccus sp. G192]